MAFELKPLKEYLAAGEQKINEMMAPVRAGLIRAQADTEMYKLKEKILKAQSKIEEKFASFSEEKNIDFDTIFKAFDEISLLEMRLEQYEDMLTKLFPEAAK